MAYVLSNGNTSKISHLIKAYCPWGMAQKPDRNRATLLNHCHRDCPHLFSEDLPRNKGVRPKREIPSVYLLDNHNIPGHFHTLGNEVRRQVTFYPQGKKTNGLVGRYLHCTWSPGLQSPHDCRGLREKGLNENNTEIHAREWMLWTERP